jgi:hypothetical protein
MNRFFFHFVVWGAVGLDSWVGPMRVRVGGKVMFGNKNIMFFWQKRSSNCDFYGRSTFLIITQPDGWVWREG